MGNAAGQNRRGLLLSLFIITGMVVAATALVSCGGGGSSASSGGAPTPTGVAAISFTDGPGDFDHVWITVKDVWFHTSDASGPNDVGWLKYPLAAPVTVDLIALGNGAAPASIWGNISLPVGNYQQIRLFLVPTFDAGPPSGHSYFNEVVVGSAVSPLRIPDAEHGIKLAGAFQITAGTPLQLAIDFDAGNDVVDFRNGAEYVLKPRLAYFDLADAGAITGQIDAAAAGTNPTSRFVFKAEQVGADGAHHVVKRYSTLSDSTGKFVIYPLPSGTYDLLLRGVGHETVIIKGVPVTKGTTPSSGPTLVPAITMPAGSDYPASSSVASPTGAWVNFYQTLPGAGELPYEVRFRHYHPLTGQFLSYPLSSSQIQVGTYNSSAITLQAVDPVGGPGAYQAVADALLYDPSAPLAVTPVAPAATFPALAVTAPSTAHAISGTINLSQQDQNKLDKGVVFVVRGGMIIDALTVDKGQINMAVGGPFSFSNLPGGAPGAFYGVDAFGWSSTVPLRRGLTPPDFVDLRGGDATGIAMNMTVVR